MLYLGLRIAQPSDGIRLDTSVQSITENGVIITPFGRGDGSLQAGDVVVAAAGHPMEAWAQALFCWQPLCDGPERPRFEMGDTVTYTIHRGEHTFDVVVRLGRYPLVDNLRSDSGAMLYALALIGIAFFTLTKRPDEPAARLLLLAGSSMVGATTWSIGLTVLDFLHPVTFWLYYITTQWVYLILWAATLHFALIFPTEHQVLVRNRWLVVLIYGFPFVTNALTVFNTELTAPSALKWLESASVTQNLIVTTYLLLGMVALVTNYRQQTNATARRQIRVVVYAIVVITAIAILVWQLPQLVLGEQIFTSNMMAFVGLLLPAALLVSITRYRLWEIDVIINRTAVYGLLTFLIAGLYVALVGGLGALFQQHSTLLLSLIATGVVAVIFQPLRDRLQRTVNRLMYGERDDPYEVISRLGRQLQSAVAPENLLDKITSSVAMALKLPYTSITILEDGQHQMLSEYGIPPKHPVELDLVYQNEVVGKLAVARRAPHELLTPPDMRLLYDIARHTGMVVHAVGLNRALRRSRERIVTLREEERRRLRRDLHDGLGPTLASHALKLDAIIDMIDRRPDAAKRLSAELKEQTQEMVTVIRQLVYQLRPPTLDQLGLVEAVQAHFLADRGQQEPMIRLEEPPGGLPLLPAAVEVAAYRIILEGITNVLRHADAQTCEVCLMVRGRTTQNLHINIIDDGRGPPEPIKNGVGLTSIRERVEELGGKWSIKPVSSGGTHLTAVLPLEKQEDVEWTP